MIITTDKINKLADALRKHRAICPFCKGFIHFHLSDEGKPQLQLGLQGEMYLCREAELLIFSILT